MFDRTLRAGDTPDAGGIPATVVVTIDYRDLLNDTGYGTFPDGTPVAPSTLLKLACEADIIPVVLGAFGEVLELGRSRPPNHTCKPEEHRKLSASEEYSIQEGHEQMSGRVVLLCGRSFSGKSSLAAWLSDALPGAVVSLDAINAERGLWGGDGIPIEEWAHTNEIGHDRVRRIIATGGTVIIDDTSSPRFLRDGWREVASSGGASLVLVYVDTPVPVIMQRLASNRSDPTRGDLTDRVLTEHLSSFESPTSDEQPLRVEPNTRPTDVLAMIKGRWS